MKKIFTLLAFVITLLAFAQAPQGFNYQAIVRNSSGALITKQIVGFKFSVKQTSSSGTTVYSETQTATPDDLGQVSLTVGTGTPITGTFAAINWASGTYYLAIELNTGSGFVAMGTTQLLSVPYAMYANSAGSSPNNFFKTSIYLTGSITDSEAAAIIASDLGPQTENIYIRNTTQLTTINLSALVRAVNIEISYNTALTDINFSGLVASYENFRIYETPLLNLSLPSLTNVNLLDINGVANFIPPAKLTNVYNISLSGLNLTSLNLSSFVKGYINVYGCLMLNSVSLPKLTSGGVSLGDNTSLTSLSLPVFSSGRFQVGNCSSLKSISLPVFTSGSFGVNSCSSLKSISLPVLTNGGVGIQIASCAELTSISLPVLKGFDLHTNGIEILYNPLLKSVSFPTLESCSEINLFGNSLTTTNINALLNKMLTVLPNSGKTIRLDRQTPLAPPTGQGITDKADLITKGNDVNTD